MIERVNIIVPTYNRVRSLKALLDSLENTNCPESIGVGIAVVDNGSNDGTSEMLAQEAARPRRYPLTVLKESRRGKASAVNLGVARSKADLFLILDDDVSVDPCCLVAHLEAYRDQAFAAVQGKVLPGKDEQGREADPNKIRQYNIPVVDHGPQIVEIRGFIGTNVSFLRCVPDKVGLFDARLGPGASGFSEDSEYSVRVRQAGFRIGYTPYAVAYHELNSARYGRDYNRTVQYRKGVSRSVYRHDPVISKIVPNLLGQCLRYAIYCLTGNKEKLHKAEGGIMKSCGYVAGKLRKWSGRR